MKQACATLPKTLRLLALAVALSPMLTAMPVLADDYSDVNQLLRGGKFSDALAKADQYLQGKPRDPQMSNLSPASHSMPLQPSPNSLKTTPNCLSLTII
jgi:hypothetical protein